MSAPEETGAAAPDAALAALIAREVEAQVTARLGALEETVRSLPGGHALGRGTEERTSIIVMSGDFDRLFAAFTIAMGSLAMGMEVSMYFTFWGLTALKKTTILEGKTLPEKMVAMMLPGGIEQVPTSRMNMGGIGPKFFQHLMRTRNVESLPDMRDMAIEMGAKVVACEMSMNVMGLTRAELLEGLSYGGVATYLEDAAKAKITLFI